MNYSDNRKEYKEAFREFCRLHKHRYSGGEMGKKYLEAHKRLCDAEKCLPARV